MAEKRLAVFRFDRDPLLCRAAVSRLRELNPGVPVHGLYGAGRGLRQPAVRLGARPVLRLDSCYHSRHEGRWNWAHGDLALLEWYRDIGRRLDFDVLHLVEWDLVLRAPLRAVYRHVPAGAVALTCLTPVAEITGSWEWLRGPDRLRDWDALLALARERWGHTGQPLACLGVGPAFPRAFLDAYASLDPPELCHDELRLPLAAQALGFRLVDTGFRRRWHDPDEDVFFNVGGAPVDPATVDTAPDGRRAFHPVRGRPPRIRR